MVGDYVATGSLLELTKVSAFLPGKDNTVPLS